MRRTLLILCLGAVVCWADNPVVTQQAEILTAPRSSTATPLLFSWVVSFAGFDTEITISNTSQDTLGSTPHSGTCVLNFYGPSAPAPQTSSPIPAGQQLVFNLSQGGGGIAPAPNFDGYMFAVCSFPLARGTAKVFAPTTLAFSQDAQVVTLPRSTATSEQLLFPFVTNLAGFDTGIAIPNTSADPFGSTPGSGTCILSFYGSNAPVDAVTSPIAAGTVWADTISTLAPSFEGYVIASCTFTPGGGIAFVSDVGARTLAFSETPEPLTTPRSTTDQSLLFSSVTNQNGLDTGISIANTTTDPFGTVPVSASCTLNFYGANAPAALTTPSIASGSMYLNTISTIAPNFQGYIIASCDFPLSRGYAFITNVGATADGDSVTPEVATLPRSTASTTLLFSTVSNWNGNDTTINISNTSLDPFGTVSSSGTCTLSYFGRMVNGGSTPASQTSSSIAAGTQLSFTLSAGNAAQSIAATPGFRGYIIAACGFPLARGLATISGTPQGATVDVTVTSAPSGLSVSADRQSYTAPQVLNWIVGSTHSLTTSSPQGTGGTKYVFNNWNIGAAASQSVTAVASNTTYTANFTQQYLLTTSVSPTGGGSITAGGFINAGASPSISAAPNPGYEFVSFTGDITGTTNPQNLTMNAPMNVVAVFQTIPNNRSFVSTTGNDANNCSANAFCRTFGRALTATKAGGEIVVVNSGGYGPVTIAQPVVITASDIDASITATSGNAITINTTGNVTITGLNLNGSGTGNDGVLVQSVGFLRLYNMQIQNFANNGIEFTSNGNLAVYDSKVNDSGQAGLLLNHAAAQAYIHNTDFDHNVLAGAFSIIGNMTIADSSAHYNGAGFFTNGGTVALDNDSAMSNTFGLEANSGGTLSFAHCLISDNTVAWTVTPGSTMTDSSPGTNLVAPGQGTGGTLSAATVLQ